MNKNNIELFIKFLFSNKALNHIQKREVSKLLARDASYIQNTTNINIEGTGDNNSSTITVSEDSRTPKDSFDCTIVDEPYKPTIIDTETIFRFLHLFGEKEALKYTTHTWERSPETGEFIFQDFMVFKKQYSDILEKWKHKILFLGNTDLWMLVCNFLLNDETKFYWGEEKIRIGYNKYLAKWMKDNPGNQPFSMPLSEFPESIRPGIINKRSLNSFYDVVEIFKHSIEFRDNDLYIAIKRIFKNKSFIINKEKLTTLQGVSFYSHTQKVKNALEVIAGNIFNRAEYPNIEISCLTNTGKERNSIQLEILQLDSYSNKDVNNPKVLGTDSNGDISSIKNLLRNLCDFSVVSRFKQDDEFKCLRINYLVSGNNAVSGIESIHEDDCKGFKYILTFYNYNIS